METGTRYFEQGGRGCTAETLRAARERAVQLGVRSVVVASTHGWTALEAAAAFEGTGIRVIAVSLSAAFENEGWTMTPPERAALEARGIPVLTCLHSLADGIAEGFLGESTPGNIVANTLRWFSQGMKVAVETSIMVVEDRAGDRGCRDRRRGGHHRRGGHRDRDQALVRPDGQGPPGLRDSLQAADRLKGLFP